MACTISAKALYESWSTKIPFCVCRWHLGEGDFKAIAWYCQHIAPSGDLDSVSNRLFRNKNDDILKDRIAPAHWNLNSQPARPSCPLPSLPLAPLIQLLTVSTCLTLHHDVSSDRPTAAPRPNVNALILLDGELRG